MSESLLIGDKSDMCDRRHVGIYLDSIEKYELEVVDSKINFDFQMFCFHLWWVLLKTTNDRNEKLTTALFYFPHDMHSFINPIISMKRHVHDFAIHQTDGRKSISKLADWMFRKFSY